MKLYAWQPSGHGELSFFVIAESEDAARSAVQAHIENGLKKKSFLDGGISAYEVGGWGTDYYRLTVAEVDVVLTNNNT